MYTIGVCWFGLWCLYGNCRAFARPVGVQCDGGCRWINGMAQAAATKSFNRGGTCAIDAVVLYQSLKVSLSLYGVYVSWSWWSRWSLSVEGWWK